jgi:hypothetical protein
VKKFITAASSHEGAFDTSTTTEAPFSASATPCPVMEFTPDLGDPSIASCPRSRNLVTTLDPISPLPPITTIFMIASLSFDLCISNLPIVLAEDLDAFEGRRVLIA